MDKPDLFDIILRLLSEIKPKKNSEEKLKLAADLLTDYASKRKDRIAAGKASAEAKKAQKTGNSVVNEVYQNGISSVDNHHHHHQQHLKEKEKDLKEKNIPTPIRFGVDNSGQFVTACWHDAYTALGLGRPQLNGRDLSYCKKLGDFLVQQKVPEEEVRAVMVAYLRDDFERTKRGVSPQKLLNAWGEWATRVREMPKQHRPGHQPMGSKQQWEGMA